MLIQKWTVCVVVCSFLTGLSLCLIADLNGSAHQSEASSAMTEVAQACGISVVPCEGQLASNRLPLILSLSTEQNTFYEGIWLTPPFPPPRG
ncbi:MAG: hypothetical protein ACE5G5_08360 [Candidatus Methylomirabilales bacterium]